MAEMTTLADTLVNQLLRRCGPKRPRGRAGDDDAVVEGVVDEDEDDAEDEEEEEEEEEDDEDQDEDDEDEDEDEDADEDETVVTPE